MDRPIKYQQADARWGAQSYSAPGESTTIAKAGCGPTCAAMVIASLTDPSVTPVDTCKWSLDHGYKALKQGTFYSYFVPQLSEYDIKCRQIGGANTYGKTDAAAKKVYREVESELKKGNWIISVMGKGVWTSAGHFILAYKTDGTRVYINDPASEKAMRECNMLELWEKEAKYFWVIEVPKAPKEDDEVIEKKEITIFGRTYKADTIFKDGRNFVSPRVFEEAGFDVSSAQSEAIINPGTIKVSVDGKEHIITGFNSDGLTYAGVRKIAEMLGCKVDWKDGIVTIEK